jgi:RNA-splicing ligase RtcB
MIHSGSRAIGQGIRNHHLAQADDVGGGGRRAADGVARERAVGERDLRRQMQDVWYDERLSSRLRDEAPAAYKDIRSVLRAQHDLIKVTRVLRPVLNYKGL